MSYSVMDIMFACVSNVIQRYGDHVCLCIECHTALWTSCLLVYLMAYSVMDIMFACVSNVKQRYGYHVC